LLASPGAHHTAVDGHWRGGVTPRQTLIGSSRASFFNLQRHFIPPALTAAFAHVRRLRAIQATAAETPSSLAAPWAWRRSPSAGGGLAWRALGRGSLKLISGTPRTRNSCTGSMASPRAACCMANALTAGAGGHFAWAQTDYELVQRGKERPLILHVLPPFSSLPSLSSYHFR